MLQLPDDRRPPITPQLALRVAILGGAALTMFAIIFFRLWYLQVLSGDKYRAQANNNRIRDVVVPAPRGDIVDRNGTVLVDNRVSIAVQIDPRKLPPAGFELAFDGLPTSFATYMETNKMFLKASAIRWSHVMLLAANMPNWLPVAIVIAVPVGFLSLLFIVALAEKRLVVPYQFVPPERQVPLPPYVQVMATDIAAAGFHFGGVTVHRKYPFVKILGTVWLSPTRETLVYSGSGLAGNKALIEWAAAHGLAWDRWDDGRGDAFRARYESYLTDPATEPRKTRRDIPRTRWQAWARHRRRTIRASPRNTMVSLRSRGQV